MKITAKITVPVMFSKDVSIALYLETDRLLCELADDLRDGRFYGKPVTPGQAVDSDDFYYAVRDAAETAGVAPADEVFDYLQRAFITSGRLGEINRKRGLS